MNVICTQNSLCGARSFPSIGKVENVFGRQKQAIWLALEETQDTTLRWPYEDVGIRVSHSFSFLTFLFQVEIKRRTLDKTKCCKESKMSLEETRGHWNNRVLG